MSSSTSNKQPQAQAQTQAQPQSQIQPPSQNQPQQPQLQSQPQPQLPPQSYFQAQPQLQSQIQPQPQPQQTSQPTANPATPAKASLADKKEIVTYEAPWTIFGMSWSVRPDKRFRLALGSFMEEYANKVEIIQLNEESGRFTSVATINHPYPTTKVMWIPDRVGDMEDLFATSGDYLRVWKMSNEGAAIKGVYNNNKSSEFCAPLTSFDWNEKDPTVIGTSSIDTTCTIWDIKTQQAKTQLIAHDKEVYDIAFAPSPDIFASVGADGSLRMFDLRALEHSTIVYESPNSIPLLRLSWNKLDENYLATMLLDQKSVIIVDIRVPTSPVAELNGHSNCVNSVGWAPHSSCHVCTSGDDGQAFIWDLSVMPQPVTEPILAYSAEAEICNMQWSSNQPEWVAIAFKNKLQILRV